MRRGRGVSPLRTSGGQPRTGQDGRLRHMAAMIDLYNDETDLLIGSITEADLKLLQDALEEESIEDQDYYSDRATIDVIGDGRATEHLLNVLRDGLGSSDGIDIRWERR